MGIRDRPIAPRSPWQNGYCERLIGSIRRECLDHVVVFGERHLRHLLQSYANYYNQARTHLSLNKDAPVSRAIQIVGRILAVPILGGLHHHPDLVSDRDTGVAPARQGGSPTNSPSWRAHIPHLGWH
jgi:Integrase core domain